MKNLYAEQWRLFKDSYWKLFLILFAVFIGSGFLVYFIVGEHIGIIEKLMGEILSSFEESNLLDPNMTQLGLAIGLFKNNVTVCIIIVASGFIPIFLPTIGIIIVNGGIMGVLFAYLSHMNESVATTFFAGILPHGILEIPAIVLSAALAFYTSISIYKKIANNDFSFKNAAANTVKTFALVCVPFLILAAIIEAYITPLILGTVGY